MLRNETASPTSPHEAPEREDLAPGRPADAFFRGGLIDDTPPRAARTARPWPPIRNSGAEFMQLVGRHPPARGPSRSQPAPCPTPPRPARYGTVRWPLEETDPQPTNWRNPPVEPTPPARGPHARPWPNPTGPRPGPDRRPRRPDPKALPRPTGEAITQSPAGQHSTRRRPARSPRRSAQHRRAPRGPEAILESTKRARIDTASPPPAGTRDGQFQARESAKVQKKCKRWFET